MKTLCIREEYQSDGGTKVKWNQIGVLFKSKNGKEYMKLFHMPNSLISVFEQKKEEKVVNDDFESQEFPETEMNF